MEQRDYIIIGGTFKSGTSALFTYLGQVPGICPSEVKETGFFVPVRYGLPSENIDKYHEFFKTVSEKDRYLMEASPGYLRGGSGTATYIRKFLGRQPKMIFLFRDPVERFISLYKMVRENNDVYISREVAEAGMTLDDYFTACKVYNGNTDFDQEPRDYLFNGLTDGHYSTFLKEWLSMYPATDIRIVFFENLIRDPESVCKDLLHWLNLDPSGTEGIVFRPVNQYHSARSKALRAFAYRMNKRFQGFFRRNDRLKRWLIRWYHRVNAQKSLSEDPYTQTRQQLQEYYQVHNKELKALLSAHGYSDFPDWLNA